MPESMKGTLAVGHLGGRRGAVSPLISECLIDGLDGGGFDESLEEESMSYTVSICSPRWARPDGVPSSSGRPSAASSEARAGDDAARGAAAAVSPTTARQTAR